MDEKFTIEQIFLSADKIIRNLPENGPLKPSDELKLKLYSYYKQAKEGPNKTPRPKFYQLVELYKWNAWKKLADMTREEAMTSYSSELKKIIKSLSEKGSQLEGREHLENLLGDELFEYWFADWLGKPTTSTSMSSSVSLLSVTSSLQHVANESGERFHDLEDAMSDTDCYKTVSNTMASNKQGTFSAEVSDQVTSAVSRLQHGLRLVDTNSSEPLSKRQQQQPGEQIQGIANCHYVGSNSFLTPFNSHWIVSQSAKMTSQQPFDTNCMTLTRFLIAEQRKYPTASGELTTLLNALQTAIKSVSSAVRRAGMINLFGLADTQNTSGDDVKRLDVLSNELFINMLKASYTVHRMISEENDSIMEVDEDKAGKYFIAFDPLDGSSNIEASVSIGSIFAVYRSEPKAKGLPSGRSIVAAGYALYGSSTVVVLAINDRVQSFMLDPAIGEFILTDSNIRMKSRGNIYSVNEGYHSKWDQAMKDYVNRKKYPSEKGQKPYSSRYVGSMVADMHRTFKYGGIFMYPRTMDSPNGKLRLLYECNPMAFIAEKAGGKAMAWPGQAILDLEPSQIHQRAPVFIGSAEDVDEVMGDYTRLGLQ